MYIAAYLLNIILLLILIWICMFLVILVHEVGHAIMCQILFRDKNWHIRIGTGRPIIKLKKFTVRVFPISGFCNFTPKYKGSKFQYIMIYLGGPLANVFSIVLLIFLLQIIKANELTFEQRNLVWFLEFTFWTNVGQFVCTVVPMKYPFWPYKGYISDGMRILKLVRESSKSWEWSFFHKNTNVGVF